MMRRQNSADQLIGWLVKSALRVGCPSALLFLVTQVDLSVLYCQLRMNPIPLVPFSLSIWACCELQHDCGRIVGNPSLIPSISGLPLEGFTVQAHETGGRVDVTAPRTHPCWCGRELFGATASHSRHSKRPIIKPRGGEGSKPRFFGTQNHP
jgi:hypothetical protein